MPPRRGRGRGRGRSTGPGPIRRSARGATRAAAQPIPASARGRRGRGAHLATGGNRSETDTAQPSQALPDALNELLALVRGEVASGGAQRGVGADQGNSAPGSGGGQSTGHGGSTSSAQGTWLITVVVDNVVDKVVDKIKKKVKNLAWGAKISQAGHCWRVTSLLWRGAGTHGPLQRSSV